MTPWDSRRSGHIGMVLLGRKCAKGFTKMFFVFFNFFTLISFTRTGYSFSYYISVEGF